MMGLGTTRRGKIWGNMKEYKTHSVEEVKIVVGTL
jgi:hypothetical protein